MPGLFTPEEQEKSLHKNELLLTVTMKLAESVSLQSGLRVGWLVGPVQVRPSPQRPPIIADSLLSGQRLSLESRYATPVQLFSLPQNLRSISLSVNTDTITLPSGVRLGFVEVNSLPTRAVLSSGVRSAFNRADESRRDELLKWVTAEKFDPKEKIAAVTDIYNKVGIKRLAEEKIEYYFAQSRKYLAAIKVDDERKAVLTDYTDQMMRREK